MHGNNRMIREKNIEIRQQQAKQNVKQTGKKIR